METRPADVYGADPIETDNGIRPEDGDQDVSQNPEDDYSEASDA